ncbi:hypothetical protein SMGD1_1727 [Sulfurimonas gotlandica GD1]|uniref:FecR protein domain-containing protein n=1 Tax=Sulfurimonas gotlandica (strain DSM 19862 / JCM 16533 / GD1) TaxID=929558 RepID=B6BIA0_SULGG|nr:FecR domain-containing protein [Sulfurimonas gotlandica]EDZ62807.1 conserved hypothetical protein [Sulfurimonas gotlandica GD1]EHP30250.1 hypothetical protein SMGD1_1727 [Sulfurimonas gotlandica GD1]
MKLLTKIVLLVFLLSAAMFAKDVATVTALNGKAFVEREGTKVEITIGASLQEKDTILTDDKAKVQIIFTDETIVTVGKNSNFSISEYMFEDSQEPVAKFAMIKGAMRTITGKIGKIAPDKFQVQAKTALIGIRGTNFSVLVGEDDSVNVYCTYGAISVTVDGTEHVVQQGFYISVSPDGKVEIKEFSPQDLKDMKDKNFGKSASKKGNATDDATASNEGQIDTTTEEMDNIVIKDISDSVVDAEQTSSEGPTANSVIAGYSMTNAQYTGTFSTTSNNTPSFPNSGTANFDVNFGADTATLTLNPGFGQSETATYNETYTGLNTNTFSVDKGSPGGGLPEGTASGIFYGQSGNTAKGDFTYVPDGYTTSQKAIGTFNVTTTQTLQ